MTLYDVLVVGFVLVESVAEWTGQEQLGVLVIFSMWVERGRFSDCPRLLFVTFLSR